MDELRIGNYIIKECSYAPSRYDLFVELKADGDKRKNDYQRDVAYGIDLERAILIIIESGSFNKTENDSLIEFLSKYREEKKLVMSELSKLLSK